MHEVEIIMKIKKPVRLRRICKSERQDESRA